MDSSSRNHDDVVFDRLVDGELSADERRRLLASLDGQADGWRRCALAFLEAQSWRRELRGFAEPAAPATPAVHAPVPRRAGRSGWLLATAAAVLAAFGLGRQFASPRVGDPADAADLIADASPAGETPGDDAAPDAEPLDDADAVTLWVHDRRGVPQRVVVPLVDGSRLGEQFADSPTWVDPELRARLARQGIGLEARRRYAPLFFEQENQLVPMVVPVDDAKITPVSLPIY